MQTIASRLTGILEVLISLIGAVLLVVQSVTGADGVAQVAAALVTLVAPICGAIRETRGSNVITQAEAVAEAVTDTLDEAATT
ncbi:MAG: hypothetical protein AAFV54_01145 [Pseudomonadota bacterium]